MEDNFYFLVINSYVPSVLIIYLFLNLINGSGNNCLISMAIEKAVCMLIIGHFNIYEVQSFV